MAQLWGGRFTKETDQLVYNFNASISFDQKFYKEDIEGSIAHVTMLGKQGIISQAESNDIVACLKQILKEVESGELEISSKYEDIHSFVEATLIDRLGDTGKKPHRLSCRALHICRRPSQSLWLTIWAHILRCLRGTDQDCAIYIRE